jgi:hypothetical protein
MANPECENCPPQKIAWSRQDTVYMIPATIVNLLIVMSLLENLGII